MRSIFESGRDLYRSLRKIVTQTGLVRPLALISLLLFSSFIFFFDLYYSLLSLATSLDLLSSNGAYPFVMLLFLLLWMLSNKKKLISTLSDDGSRFRFTYYSATGLFLALISLTGKLLLQGQGMLILQLFLLLGFLQGCMMFTLPATSRTTLKAVAIYVPCASLPIITLAFLDTPISLGFLFVLVPTLKVLGYPVQQVEQTILLQRSSSQISPLYINSACAGPASYSIFLFLNGLMIIDLGVERKRAALFTAGGLGTLYVLNLLRVVLIVHATYHYGDAVGASVHLYLGYILFSIFYLIYVLLFVRTSSYRSS